MPVQRSTILRGPAVIQFRGAQIISKDDVTVEFGYDTFDIETSMYGKADERYTNRFARVRFTPSGEYTGSSGKNYFATYFPYDNVTVKIGQSIFGATDTPMVIKGRDGNIVTFAASAITRMPDAILSADKTTYGGIEFLCIGADNTAWSAANSFVTFSTGTYGPGDDAFTPLDVFTVPYTASWSPPNAVGWPASMNTVDGWTIAFELATDPISTDADGVVDHTFRRLNVTARARTIGIDPTLINQALHWQGMGAVRGASANANGADLVIKGGQSGQPQFTLYKAALKTGNYIWGPSAHRVGELTWVATLPLVTGATDKPLFKADVVP
jgi:hypothetical protein